MVFSGFCIKTKQQLTKTFHAKAICLRKVLFFHFPAPKNAETMRDRGKYTHALSLPLSLTHTHMRREGEKGLPRNILITVNSSHLTPILKQRVQRVTDTDTAKEDWKISSPRCSHINWATK